MRNRIHLSGSLLLVSAGLVIAGFGNQPASEEEPTPRRTRPDAMADGAVDIFYCTQSAGFRHPVLPETREIMSKLGEKHDWLRVTVSDDIADLTPEALERLDVVMFYTTGELPMTEEQKSAFVQFCESGGGFVGVHSATDTFYQWPWYVEHIGGSFNGHPWHEEVGILVDDRAHPSTRHFDGDRFVITDEIYMFKNENPDRQVLLRLDPESVEDRANGVYPKTSWTRRTGAGPVFYTALGHRSEVWNDERFIRHLLGGIRWAAGVDE
ncbi:MAG: ThuA domain-containing protein [Phycisphaerales bacterium]